jgi:hypothetical protein
MARPRSGTLSLAPLLRALLPVCIAALLVILTTSGCARWSPYTPQTLRVPAAGGLETTTLGLVRQVRAAGWKILQHDTPGGYFLVYAKTGAGEVGFTQWGGVAKRDNFFHVQVEPGGVVTIGADGYSVQDGDIHVWLEEERQNLIAIIERRAGMQIAPQPQPAPRSAATPQPVTHQPAGAP